jgi:endonuclease YncB( thermonuclease family)
VPKGDIRCAVNSTLTESVTTMMASGGVCVIAGNATSKSSDGTYSSDTVRLHHKKPDVRLVGFNAPETRRAKCEAERELGDKATRRVRDLVRDQPLDFERVACSCPAGTAGTRFCNYGRWCGTLKAGGRDIGDILIAEGLAVPFKCYATSCPKTPRPWCEPKS